MSNETIQMENEIQLAFGARLRHIRGDRSREAFAQRIGVSSSAINNYENGIRSPGLPFIFRIYRFEHIMPSWLILGLGSPYFKDEEHEKVMFELNPERALVSSILNKEKIILTDNQRNAIANIISEDLRKKIKAIAAAIVE